METFVRRYRSGYLLPTEAVEILQGMISRSIKHIVLGLKSQSLEEIIHGSSSPPFSSYGGAVIIFYDDESVIFYDDDIQESIVLRKVNRGVIDSDFFEKLEHEDKMGFRSCPRYAVDFSKHIPIDGKVIECIEVYGIEPIFRGSIKISSELMLRFIFDDLSFVLGCKMIDKHPVDFGRYVRFSTWDRLEKKIQGESAT